MTVGMESLVLRFVFCGKSNHWFDRKMEVSLQAFRTLTPQGDTSRLPFHGPVTLGFQGQGRLPIRRKIWLLEL